MLTEAMRLARHARLSQALKDAGLKLTPQRLRICEVLSETENHPTAYEVFERARQAGVSLATIYNTMNTLETLGLISEIGSTSDGSLHYELNPEPHLNLICLGCSQITDLPADSSLKGLMAGVERSGYRVVGTKLVVYGYCDDCKQTRPKAPSIQTDAD